MLLTIVITTFNRANVLERLLRSLSHQSDREFEVVVAIDGSTDDTLSMLSKLEVDYPLRWTNTHCAGYGLAMARNRGIIEAKGSAIAIIDDDCFPVPEFVAAHKASVIDKTITGGLRTPSNNADTAQVRKMEELKKLPINTPMPLEQLRSSWPRAVTTECNICMLRDDLISMGLFSERLKLYGFIGQEFFARARHLGYKYQFNPKAEIVHHRQHDGDNSLSAKRKNWQIQVSSAIRPSLMNEPEYEKQVAWAQEAVRRYPETIPLPAIPFAAYLQFPYRFARGQARRLRIWARQHRGTA